jgi:type IV secretion system protein VirB11
MAIDIDPRASSERSFMEAMKPVLNVARAVENCSDVFIDGNRISISDGDKVERYSFADFPGFTAGSVRAACNSAATYADVEFGPQEPAKPRLSIKIGRDMRVSAARPPISDVWTLTIRFLGARKKTLEDYVAAGIMTEVQHLQIAKLIDDRKNIIISGSTLSGKTTLLRAMLTYAVRGGDRLVIIEDAPELTLEAADVVHLHTSAGTTMSDLLHLTLRLSPSRITVGEVRGPEALALLQAMNTGHDGCQATLHSNGAEEAIERLHTLCQESQPGFTRRSVVRAIDAVIQIQGQGRNRRVSDVWLVDKAG